MNTEHKNETKKYNKCLQRDNMNQMILCKLCNETINKTEYQNHIEQSNHTELMINLIEQQSKQINYLIDKLNSLFEYEKIYENIWIISNFINKINNEVKIESPYIELYPYSFFITASKQGTGINSKLNITLNPSVVIKNEYSNKITLLLSITLLNSKSLNNNIIKSSSIFEFDCDNLIGDGYTFNLNDINKDNGFINDDNSLQLQFKISIKKTPFKS